eukprot:scaffold94521_cov23-Tisochrysis_lutea.AAC.1
MPRAQQLGAGQHMQHQLPHIPQQQWPPQQRGVATGEYMLAAASTRCQEIWDLVHAELLPNVFTGNLNFPCLLLHRKYRTPGAVTINARALRPINQLSKQDSFMVRFPQWTTGDHSGALFMHSCGNRPAQEVVS